MIKLVVFDWNGTLLSDARACMDADNAVLRALGGKEVSFRQFQQTVVIPAINFYVQHGLTRVNVEKHAKKANEIFHATYEYRAAKCRTRAGARQLLRWLKKQGIISIILSNHTVTGINIQLARLGIKQYFALVLANPKKGTSLKRQIKGERLKNYLNKNNYKQTEALIIGDTPEETEIGKKLGIVTVGITGGYHTTARILAAKPDFVIHNLARLKKVLCFIERRV